MNGHEKILERAQRCNPVPRLETIHESDLADLDSLLDRRRSAMTDTKQQPRNVDRPAPLRRSKLRPALVFAVALVLTLGVIGVVSLFTGGEGGVVVDTPVATVEPTTAPTPPPTTVPETESEVSEPTTTPPPPPPLGPPVIDTRIGDIAFDASGNAWVIGNDDLFLLTDTGWTTVELPAGFAEPGLVRGFDDGSVWITAMEGGLARYQDGTWTSYRPPETIEHRGATVAVGSACGPAMAVDAAGDIWVICPDMLARFDEGEFSYAEVFDDLAGGWWLMAGPDGAVHKTEFDDLMVYDGSEWTSYECAPVGPSTFGCAQLLGVDSEGYLWVALGWEGADGLARFSTPGYVRQVVEGGAAGAVDMAETTDGDLWFAVPEYGEGALDPGQVTAAGLYRFDGTTWRRYTTEDGLNHNSINRVEVAPDGTLWVGASLWTPILGDDDLPIGWESAGGIDVYDPALDRFAPLGATP